MNVMYAYDDNYAEIAAISIKSLLETNKEYIHLFLIQDKVSYENQKRMENMLIGENVEVTFIEKPDIRGIIGVELTTLRWSDSTYSRLFLKELFKEDETVDKLLYIDCDTLITDSLENLYNENIDDYLGAACLECMSKWHKKIIGASAKDNYVNNGMILFNVKQWKEENVDQMMKDFIKKYNGRTEYVDQGVINGTISNRLKIVSPRYNLTSLAYDFTYEEMQIYRKPDFGYTKDEWEEAVKRPAVVHFTTSFLSVRPWYENSNHPYAEKWKSIHEKSPWQGMGYRTLENRDKRDFKEKMYRKLPAGLSVRIAGFLHSYVKPYWYVLSGLIKR